jgi:hypothetical protein
MWLVAPEEEKDLNFGMYENKTRRKNIFLE